MGQNKEKRYMCLFEISNSAAKNSMVLAPIEAIYIFRHQFDDFNVLEKSYC